MALAINWTEEAEGQLDEIIDYLAQYWIEKEIRSFFEKLEKSLEELSQYPHRYKKSMRKQDCHEYLLSAQTTIFYDYDDRVVNILVLWVNKKDPSSLK